MKFSLFHHCWVLILFKFNYCLTELIERTFTAVRQKWWIWRFAFVSRHALKISELFIYEYWELMLHHKTYYNCVDLAINSGNVFDHCERHLDVENQPARNNFQLINFWGSLDMVKPFYPKSGGKSLERYVMDWYISVGSLEEKTYQNSLKTNSLKTTHPENLKTFVTKASVLKRVNSVYLIQMRPLYNCF